MTFFENLKNKSRLAKPYFGTRVFRNVLKRDGCRYCQMHWRTPGTPTVCWRVATLPTPTGTVGTLRPTFDRDCFDGGRLRNGPHSICDPVIRGLFAFHGTGLVFRRRGTFLFSFISAFVCRWTYRFCLGKHAEPGQILGMAMLANVNW